MQRFYTPHALNLGQYTLAPELAHHMRVLRMRVGDTVQLFNGTGASWLATIDALDKTVDVCLYEQTPYDAAGTELPFDITVAQSLVEPSKMDWVVEKAVELGVSKVLPIAAARSVTKLDADRAAKRVQHWQAIVIAASEQCGRNTLMQIAPPQTMAQALVQPAMPDKPINTQSHLKASTHSTHLLLHPEGGMPLQRWCAQHAPQAVTLWIGPEGGWSKEELVKLEAAGAQRITFGPRVLRTESAAAAIAAAMQALWVNG